jgi:AcrR family transcriptional regulator
MNPASAHPQLKSKPDDTRARIIETADALFRRMGYAKTAVADIAAELDMSPANVYRFFPSKLAIVEAICQLCLAEAEEKIWTAARSRGTASERLERAVLEILAYHKENLFEETRIHDMVLVAMEQSWAAIVAHKERVRTAVELILRDGIDAGEFEKVDPRETAAIIMHAFVAYCHPLLIAQGLKDGEDLEAGARAMIRFQLRAITPRN